MTKSSTMSDPLARPRTSLRGIGCARAAACAAARWGRAIGGMQCTLVVCLALLLSLYGSPSRAAWVSVTEPGMSVLELVSPSSTVFPGSSSNDSPPLGTHVPFSGSAFRGPFDAVLWDGHDGCQPGDFAGFTIGYIALLARGNCTFNVKALMAEAAGAAGMIVYDTGINFTGGSICPSAPCALDLPSILATQEVGNLLLDALANGPATARMAVVAEVSEPASIALFGLGMVCALARRRSRQAPADTDRRQGTGHDLPHIR